MDGMNKISRNLTRRNFLSKTGRGLAGAAFLPFVTTFCAQASEKKLGVALVGLGNYSSYQLGPALLETEYCYLAGIVTGTKYKEKIWSDRYNIKPENIYNYENFDSIKNNKDIDIVYVVLPNSMHAEFTIRAAKAGKHVICEKPMAVSVAEGRQMIEACAQNNVKLSIGYRLHFDPNHMKIMRLAEEKPFGAIKYVQAEFGFPIGDPNQWRLKKKLAGGGAVMDVGIYCVQAARYSTGLEPVAVIAQEFKTDPLKFNEVDETVTWQLEFPNGTIANSTTSYVTSTNRLYVSAGRDFYELQPAYNYGGVQGHVRNEPLNYPEVNQQARQMDAFALNIKNNTESTVSGEEGLRDMKVIEAIYKSVESGGKRIEI